MERGVGSQLAANRIDWEKNGYGCYGSVGLVCALFKEQDGNRAAQTGHETVTGMFFNLIFTARE